MITKWFVGIAGSIIVICWLYQANVNSAPNEERTARQEKVEKKSPAQIRNDRIQAQFSSWDGRHLGLAKYIKRHMYNSKSWKHIKTIYYDLGDYLMVHTTFSGTNAYGTRVINTVVAKATLAGKLSHIRWVE